MSASGRVARCTIQAAISSNLPYSSVKMFGMSVGVMGGWAISDVHVRVCQYQNLRL